MLSLPLLIAALSNPLPPTVEIDYGAIVDRRELSHSGETVGALLTRLKADPGDGTALKLLDPLLEGYAFVLSDWIDMNNSAPKPLVELGSLYIPGSPQPAWAELLHSRHLILESDGHGAMRAFVPRARADQADPKAAWEAIWPVIRLPLAAERARLGDKVPIRVEVYSFWHLPERTTFLLDTAPYRVEVVDTLPRGDRPPLDLAAWDRWLASSRLLEGARLTPSGELVPYFSDAAAPMKLLGRNLTRADLAVAYRAVFHGGLLEPYMSLDRGPAPEIAQVTYGGRLKDSSLGLVSLLCDIRFKTFSLGFDTLLGADRREQVRKSVSSFKTHLERFVTDPGSATAPLQQTRLWFYPDRVDLTLSEQSDSLTLHRVRMSASAERVDGQGEIAPWTKATIAAIDQDYDRLATLFPELLDLDTAVRLLSLFTWLREAERQGLTIPDLDALLAVELPAEPTPREYPQQLAAVALSGNSLLAQFDQAPAGVALHRLQPTLDRPLAAKRRLARALAQLDPRLADHAALAKELEPILKGDDVEAQDAAAYRAERLLMHRMVLATVSEREKSSLTLDTNAKPPRFLSIGIGGIDLGMGQALDRASRRSLGFGGAARIATTRPNTPAAPRAEWRKESGDSVRPTPAHDPARFATTPTGKRASYDAAGPEARTRLIELDAQGTKVFGFQRYERGQQLHFAFGPLERNRVSVRSGLTAALNAPPTGDSTAPGKGLALMELVRQPSSAPESPTIGVRLSSSEKTLEAPLPRTVLQRIVLGPEADLAPGKALPAFQPLPAALGSVETLMVMQEWYNSLPPWEVERPAAPGEEDAARLALQLSRWWESLKLAPRAVVGVDRTASPTRFEAAPRPDRTAVLYAPSDAFPGHTENWRGLLTGGWPKERVVAALPKTHLPLIVLVSAESPDMLGERLLQLSKEPLLKGSALAVVAVGGELRSDLPATLLKAGNLAAVGVSAQLPAGLPALGNQLTAFAAALPQSPSPTTRLERLPTLFAWYF